MSATIGTQKQTEPATVPQAAKVMGQLGGASKATMQRLLGGIADDIAKADLTQHTRFDICRFFKVDLPFTVAGMINHLEHLVPVDNETPLFQHLHKAGGDHFATLDEKGKGPDEASFFILQPKKHYPTLEAVRQQVRAYDLKLATAREMASFKLHLKGVMIYCPFNVPYLLCGVDEFSPPRWRHLVSLPCSPAGEIGPLGYHWEHEDNYVGDRTAGWQYSPRIYLVRRMTPQEIADRQDLP